MYLILRNNVPTGTKFYKYKNRMQYDTMYSGAGGQRKLN